MKVKNGFLICKNMPNVYTVTKRYVANIKFKI